MTDGQDGKMQFKDLYYKYKDVIPYAIFGVLTTIVNIASYYVAAHFLKMPIMISTVIAWLLAVLFAYVTNRKWVFHSNANTVREIITEIAAFFSCRIATGIVDWGCMWIFVDILDCNDVVIKAIANVLVIVLNYIASKLLIFKEKE